MSENFDLREIVGNNWFYTNRYLSYILASFFCAYFYYKTNELIGTALVSLLTFLVLNLIHTILKNQIFISEQVQVNYQFLQDIRNEVNSVKTSQKYK